LNFIVGPEHPSGGENNFFSKIKINIQNIPGIQIRNVRASRNG
jgi:hypothetical protein